MIAKTKVDYVNLICKKQRITDQAVIHYLFKLKNEELKMILKEQRPIYKRDIKKLKKERKERLSQIPTKKEFVEDIYNKFEQKLLDTKRVSNLLEEPPEMWYPKYRKWLCKNR